MLAAALLVVGATRADLLASTLKEIHVVYSNHLDVGFNDRSWNDGPEKCDGLLSPDGEPCLPLAANVTSENFNVFLPRAAAMADAARGNGTRFAPEHAHVSHRQCTNCGPCGCGELRGWRPSVTRRLLAYRSLPFAGSPGIAAVRLLQVHLHDAAVDC